MTLSEQSIKLAKFNIYQILFSVLVFFTPLLYVNNTNELYEFPKTFLIYLMSGLITTVFLIKSLFADKPNFRKPSIYVFLFFLSVLISTAFSSHFYTSFWGYYSRFNGGFLSLLAFISLFIVAQNVFTKKDMLHLVKIAVFSSILMALLGIYQHFSGIARVYSTLGQPNWLSHYFSMLLPLVIFFYVYADKKINLWLGVYIIGFLSFWFTYSLSGIISFAAGSIALFFILLKQKINGNHFKRLALILLVSVITGLVFPGIFGQKVHDLFIDVKNTELSCFPVAYALEDEHEVSDPGSIRFALWRGTLDLIFSGPKVFFIGAGPETYPYAFQSFRTPGLNITSEWDYVFNKPHNYFLELWAETGIIGLISYIAMFVYFLKKAPLMFIPSLVCFAVGNFFGWPTVVPSLLFWLMVAAARYEETKV